MKFGYKRGNVTSAKRHSKPFFDCGGQGCHIISVRAIWDHRCAADPGFIEGLCQLY
jgi:hypothetical protein